ncbi:MAG: MFS transporter [Pyrinomonadaceae bacterium]|nr:MFS transporter [Pyrinomonadaceae bacterium]
MPNKRKFLRKAVDKIEVSAFTSSLKSRNFRLLFFGFFISLTGIWMQWVAQSWLLLKLTDSSVMLGFLGFAGNIPIFLLAPVGGALADRFSRRNILLVTQTLAVISSLILAILTISENLQVWQIFLFATVTGIINAFDIPTHQAFLADIVEKKDLMNAISLNSLLINLTRIIGPTLAGIIIVNWGEGWCFFINSVSFVPTIIAILLMKKITENKTKQRSSIIDNVIEGFKIAGEHSIIRNLLFLTALLSFVGMSFTILLPILSDKILNAGANGLGHLIGSMGAGALIAAFSFARYSNIKGLGNWILLCSVIFGAGLILLSFTNSFELSAALLFMIGFAQVVQLDSANKMIQLLASDEVRGRLMSFYVLVLMGLTPCGVLLNGWLATYIGVFNTIAVCGTLYTFLAVTVAIQIVKHIRTGQSIQIRSVSQMET